MFGGSATVERKGERKGKKKDPVWALKGKEKRKAAASRNSAFEEESKRGGPPLGKKRLPGQKEKTQMSYLKKTTDKP